MLRATVVAVLLASAMAMAEGPLVINEKGKGTSGTDFFRRTLAVGSALGDVGLRDRQRQDLGRYEGRRGGEVGDVAIRFKDRQQRCDDAPGGPHNEFQIRIEVPRDRPARAHALERSRSRTSGSKNVELHAGDLHEWATPRSTRTSRRPS